MEQTNLNEQRSPDVYGGLTTVHVPLIDLANTALSTVGIGDELEGIGVINDLAVVGFLHQCEKAGVRLVFDQYPR